MEPFLGQIQLLPYNFAPQGWVPCDGQILSIAQYTALFALIGTNFGGDGQTDVRPAEACRSSRGRRLLHRAARRFPVTQLVAIDRD